MKSRHVAGIAGLTAIAGLTLVTTVLAGFQATVPVVVNTANRTASGAFGAAYNSADSTQYIACSVTGSSTALMGICQASTAQGVTGVCTTASLSLVQTIAALDDESLVYFQWNASGECTNISVTTASFYRRAIP